MIGKRVASFSVVLIVGIAYYYNRAIVGDKNSQKLRVNINSFVKPPVCESCRGENGEPVVLSVITLNNGAMRRNIE
jgi:hypothetical protein